MIKGKFNVSYNSVMEKALQNNSEYKQKVKLWRENGFYKYGGIYESLRPLTIEEYEDGKFEKDGKNTPIITPIINASSNSPSVPTVGPPEIGITYPNIFTPGGPGNTNAVTVVEDINGATVYTNANIPKINYGTAYSATFQLVSRGAYAVGISVGILCFKNNGANWATTTGLSYATCRSYFYFCSDFQLGRYMASNTGYSHTIIPATELFILAEVGDTIFLSVQSNGDVWLGKTMSTSFYSGFTLLPTSTPSCFGVSTGAANQSDSFKVIANT